MVRLDEEEDEDARDVAEILKKSGDDDAEMDDVSPPSKRRKLSPRLDEMDAEPSSSQSVVLDDDGERPRERRRIATFLAPEPAAEEEEDEDDEEDDEYEDRPSPVPQRAVSATVATVPGSTLAPRLEISDTTQAKQEPVDVSGPMTIDLTTPARSVSASVPPPSNVSRIGKVEEEQDMDIDAEGEADEENGNGTISRSRSVSSRPGHVRSGSVRVKVEPKTGGLEIVDITPPATPAKPSDPANDTTTTAPVGLKPGKEDLPLSSAAGSLLDPKLLRGPILDLTFDETLINLSDIFNRGLSLEDRQAEPECDKDDINLSNLFPELAIYGFSAPPPPTALSFDTKNEKRVDDTGMSTGRLTYTNRLMDSKNILLSTLQPGTKFRKGGLDTDEDAVGSWDDPSDMPVADEPRDWSKVTNEVVHAPARTCLFFRLLFACLPLLMCSHCP